MSLASNEIRSLTLKSYDINTSNDATVYYSATGAEVVSANGIVADNRFTLTWYNVNLRQMMGDSFYNKFDKFHIRLNTILVGQTSTGVLAVQTVAATDGRAVDIYMSGLPWDPAPYNQGSATKSGGRVHIMSTVLPILPATAGLGVAQSVSYGYGQSPTCTFSKSSDVQNITVQMVQQSNQTAYIPASSALLYGHVDYIFEIHGLVDNETFTQVDNNVFLRENGNHRYTPASDFKDKTLFR